MNLEFGDWFYDDSIQTLRRAFKDAKPFEHVVIPNFFQEHVAIQIHTEFPDPLDTTYDWKLYDNPIEKKYTLNIFEGLPVIHNIFDRLQSAELVNAISRITGIDELESDPYFHGAGIHAYPNRGKLDMHLDYSIHPITKKERRVNLIIYMNADWRKEYGGNLELWDDKLQTHTKVIVPSWNTAVLFRTNNISYHGLPRPIDCPIGEYRKSLAIYYVSNPTETAQPRYKAEFFPYPGQPVNDQLARLYEIRKTRVIQSADLLDWPTWRTEGLQHGYW